MNTDRRRGTSYTGFTRAFVNMPHSERVAFVLFWLLLALLGVAVYGLFVAGWHP